MFCRACLPDGCAVKVLRGPVPSSLSKPDPQCPSFGGAVEAAASLSHFIRVACKLASRCPFSSQPNSDVEDVRL